MPNEATALPAGHAPVAHGRVGVLLLNLGTPSGTDYWSMRRYLKEFLSDRRVIEVPRWKWWPILNLIILTIRPGRKGKDYATIWNNERNESPFKTITRGQAEQLAARLKDEPRIVVDWAMRYATPTTESRILALKESGCDRILLLPLYPQYAAATTATACDEAFRTSDENALAACRSRRAQLSRSSRLYRCPGAIDAKASCETRFRTGKDHRDVSRNAAKIFTEGRPLSLPMPENVAAIAGKTRY